MKTSESVYRLLYFFMLRINVLASLSLVSYSDSLTYGRSSDHEDSESVSVCVGEKLFHGIFSLFTSYVSKALSFMVKKADNLEMC